VTKPFAMAEQLARVRALLRRAGRLDNGDDVTFHVGRDSREAVRRTQRFLRDEFSNRAQAVERSAAAAAATAREVADLPPDQRRDRAAALAEQQRRLDRLAV
jgi:DNA-binding response OmpR family regulator